MKWRIIGGLCVFGLGAFVVCRQVPSTVRAERVFAAPREKVWALWQEPEAIARWWGPRGYAAPTLRSDLRPGGAFLLSMQAPGGPIIYNGGTYRTVLPAQLIVADLGFVEADGRPIPGAQVPVPGRWPDSIVLTVHFEDVDAQRSRLTVTEQGVPLLMKVLSQMGWGQQFDKMEQLLQERSGP